MGEKNINKTCSICNKKATGKFYDPLWLYNENFGSKSYSNDDVAFRLEASFFQLQGKDVLICPYCQMTLDKLPEYFDVIMGKKTDYWERLNLLAEAKIISKLLTKAFKNIETLRKNVLPKKNKLEEKIKQNVKDEGEKRKAKEILAEERAQKSAERIKERATKSAEKRKKRIAVIAKKILKLLKDKLVKMPASDIDAFLKHQNVDEIKELCEEMYHKGEISRTGNYRYFILTEEKEKPKPKKTSAPKSESTDIPDQIKKLSDLKDQGILTEEEFQSKKKDLLDKM